ncbi:MAG: hypothetical protein PHE33_05270 [Bacteroidales bacterium]|nr:hypothetical protein [Bacteroidales bacterium]
MKKTVIFLLSALLIFTIFSCGSDKPAENLTDLKAKYKDKEFKDCDEFIVAAEEMMEVYFKTIDKASEGDEAAKKDIEAFEAFLDNWGNDAEKFEKECPEKFEKFEEKFETKMEPYMDKLMKLYDVDKDFDDEWEDEMTDEDFAKMLDEMTEEEWAEFNAELEAELIDE